ncbi:MAG: patatin-like phospholipase family protein [Anaerolineae bacterium]|nr:patatin-like phospholipase family protein [Anaerolineae bacterium]
MLAFVLSGGGNRGPLEVGALQVLLEHGIVPDMLVGSSAGAINAAFLAADPNPETARDLTRLWVQAREEHIFRGNRLTILWRFLTGKDSLHNNKNLQRMVAENLPDGFEFFSDVQRVKLYIVATKLETGEARVFGRNPEDRLLDAIMASTALPPFFPPWRYEDELLVDGGIAADLPVAVAVEHGAREVYALHLVDAPPRATQLSGLLNIAEQTINTVLARQQQLELAESENLRSLKLHYVPLTGFYGIPLSDMSQTEQMVESGRQQMEEYLRAHGGVSEEQRATSLRATLRTGLRSALRRLAHLPSARWSLHQKPKDISGSIELGS